MTSDTLISQVRIAIDGETKMPLRVQVFGVDDALVLEVGYDQVSFTTPDDREFEFNPPKGTTVKEAEPITPRTPTADERKSAKQKAEDARERVKVVGTGWSTVVVARSATISRAAGRSSCRPSSASCRRSRATGAPVGCSPGPPSPRC